MKKNIFLLSLVFIFVLLLFFGIKQFFSLQNIPEGNFIKEKVSPDGKYSLRLYSIMPALSADYLRGELFDKQNNKIIKNISYQKYYGDSICWLSEDIVDINGHILNIHSDEFDWRNK